MVGELPDVLLICALPNTWVCAVTSVLVFMLGHLLFTYLLLFIYLVLMHRASGIHSHPPTSSSSEVLSDRQAQSLQALERQLTKVQLKTRLMGHDVRPTLRKVSGNCRGRLDLVMQTSVPQCYLPAHWRHPATCNPAATVSCIKHGCPYMSSLHCGYIGLTYHSSLLACICPS